MDKTQSGIAGIGSGMGNLLGQQAEDLKRTNALKNKDLSDSKERGKALEGFEALLLHQMLKSMWSTVETTGMFGEDSNEAQIYRDMLNQALADSIAEGQGIGVKTMLEKELDRHTGASKGEDGSKSESVTSASPAQLKRAVP